MFTSSNFLRFADCFMSLPTKYPEVDFVFRPHPHLFHRLESKAVWGKRRTNEWKTRFLAHPNVSWSEEGDYFLEFSLSDGLIQDCGSFIPEWLYTGKPGCYMLRPDAPPEKELSPFGLECLNHYYLASKQDEIEHFISDVVLKGIDPMQQARKDFIPLVAVNHPHAAIFALEDIKQSLAKA
jgi:hypothetical protein